MEQMENTFHDHYYRMQPEITINDIADLNQEENKYVQDFISRFRKLNVKCKIPLEERHYIFMAQRALRIPLHKKFDSVLFRDLKEPADMRSSSGKVLQREPTARYQLQYIISRSTILRM
ncbi:hypothetical protein GBA52_008352 [Prunus armeniaca]|nr:hypothetical protein GBA52_008352 [Prunus armeniaca]